MHDEYGQAVPVQTNGPHWHPEVLPFYGLVSLGNMTAFKVGIFPIRFTGRYFVGVEGHGCYTFGGRNWIASSYVEEKLSLGAADACNLADFLNDQFTLEGPRQGEYRFPDLVFTEEGRGTDKIKS